MTALLTVLVLGVIVIALGVDVAAIGWCVKVFCRRRCDPAGLVDGE